MSLNMIRWALLYTCLSHFMVETAGRSTANAETAGSFSIELCSARAIRVMAPSLAFMFR